MLLTYNCWRANKCFWIYTCEVSVSDNPTNLLYFPFRLFPNTWLPYIINPLFCFWPMFSPSQIFLPKSQPLPPPPPHLYWIVLSSYPQCNCSISGSRCSTCKCNRCRCSNSMIWWTRFASQIKHSRNQCMSKSNFTFCRSYMYTCKSIHNWSHFHFSSCPICIIMLLSLHTFAEFRKSQVARHFSLFWLLITTWSSIIIVTVKIWGKNKINYCVL